MMFPTLPVSSHTAQGDELRIRGWTVWVFLTSMVTLWTVLCAVSHQAPDLDGLEELVWASSLEWGYTKHPPLPSWVMYGLVSLFGRPVWLAFLAGQLFSALALWFVWRLGREFTTPGRALLATLLTSTIAYFSLRGTIYNHNTAQLWSIAACIWLFYRALRYRSLSAWGWLGLVAALSVMTKYSAFIQFAVCAAFALVHGHMRDRRAQIGLGLATVVFLVVLAPHIHWLLTHQFAPLYYADDSMQVSSYGQVLGSALDFTLDQLARLSPMILVVLALLWWERRSGTRSPRRYAHDLHAWDRAFLLWMGLGPLLATLVVTLLLGTRLSASWGTTFFVLYGYFAFWLLSANTAQNLRRTTVLVIAVHVLMAVGYATARGPLAYYMGRPARSTFPGPQIAARMQQIWHEHVPDSSLRLIASDTWFGGNIAIHTGSQAQVYINASYEQSPWLDPVSALDCGVLVAYSVTTRGAPAPAVQQLLKQASWKGQTRLPWSSERSPTIVIDWGIIPPGPACVPEP